MQKCPYGVYGEHGLNLLDETDWSVKRFQCFRNFGMGVGIKVIRIVNKYTLRAVAAELEYRNILPVLVNTDGKSNVGNRSSGSISSYCLGTRVDIICGCRCLGRAWVA